MKPPLFSLSSLSANPLLAALFCSIAEPLLNQLIRQDPAALGRLQSIQGKQLAFELTEVPFRLVLTAQPNGIWLNQQRENVDCAVRTDLASLRLLTDPSQLTQLIRADLLQIDGDLNTLQKFSQFFSTLDPDWQQQLSHYLGDAAAHKAAHLLQQGLAALQQRVAQAGLNLTELAQDELQLSPHPAEMSWFIQDVSAVAARTDQLSRQIAALETKR